MTNDPYVPVRDPRAGTSGERTARIVCSVLAAVTVLICLPILVSTRTSSSSHDSATAPSPATASSTASASVSAVPDRAQFLTAFPAPPGSVLALTDGDRRKYRAPSTLAAVKAFYLQRFARQHVTWAPNPVTAYVGSKTVITGWRGSVSGDNGRVPYHLELTLTDGNFANTAPGTITIEVIPS